MHCGSVSSKCDRHKIGTIWGLGKPSPFYFGGRKVRTKEERTYPWMAASTFYDIWEVGEKAPLLRKMIDEESKVWRYLK